MNCPCCGKIMDDVPPETLLHLSVSPVQRRIIQYYVKKYPHYVNREQLIDWIYADDLDGGPDNPSNAISAHLYYMRPKLQEFGWAIDRIQGQGIRDSYLRKLEVAQ